MKYFIPIIILAAVFSACGGTANENAIPESLGEKKALLKEKKEELKTLTGFIAELEEAIALEDTSSVEKKARLVTTVPVVRTDFMHFVEIQGSVQADKLVDVTSEVAGRILHMTVREGDNVQQGQLIAEIDLEQLKKQKAELEVQIDLARTTFERQTRLWEQNIGSEMQYLQAKNTKERLEKSLETLDYQLTKSKIYAPITGVVERLALESGELASPGMPIVQLLNTNQLKVVASVPENYLRAVKEGETVTVKFPALDLEQKERVSLVGRTIDPANRTFDVEVRLSNPKGLFKPNLLATMMINDKTEKDVITVPLPVIQQDVSGKKFVFIRKDGPQGPAAEKVYVQTGPSYEGEIIITQGLEGGEELIIDGGRGLADEEAIEIVNAKTEANNG